jgi:hypothetical protein
MPFSVCPRLESNLGSHIEQASSNQGLLSENNARILDIPLARALWLLLVEALEGSDSSARPKNEQTWDLPDLS